MVADRPGFNWKGLVLGSTVGHYLFDSYLEYRQYNFLLGYKPKPDADEETVKTVQKAREYHLAKSRFRLFSSAIDFVINFSTIKFNLLPKLYSSVGNLLSKVSSAPLWLVGSTSQSIFLFLGVQVISSLVTLPLRYYSTFVLEEKFGFNKTTKKVFFTDIIKEQVLSVVIGAPVMAAFIKIVEYFGDSFFVYVWAAFFTFQIFMISIAPSLIMPLFNKFTPLEDGSLKTRINALAAQVKFPLTKLFLIDGSKRSSHSNAYFTGLPWSKRIVLFDTLIEKSSEDEIVAVIGHEIGHWAKSHLLKTLIFSQANLSLIFLLFSAFFRNNSFYTSFGFAPVANQPIIIGFMLFMDVLKPVECVMGFLSNVISRKHEYEADAYAVDLDYGKDLCSALQVLVKENLSIEGADPLYSAYHHSHPLTPERVSMIQKLMKQKEDAEKKEK